MIAGLNWADLASLAAALLFAGALTGIFAGLFGIGGGAILVPVLYALFNFLGVPEEVRMQLCVGTSLAIIVPTAIRSYRAHKLKGAVDQSILRIWAIPVVIGVVFAGFVLAPYSPAFVFKTVFICVAGAYAIRLLFGRDSWRIAEDFPKGSLMRFYGLMIGILSTLMGIGGGQLSNLLMTFYGRPIHQAVATSSGLGVLISVPAALLYVYAGWSAATKYPAVSALQFPFTLGYVSLIGAILVMPTSMLFAPLGVRLAHALTKRKLEIAFGIFLTTVCLLFVRSLF